ncbi:uncharacterized protein Z520_08720 [Fonsecaea multimorphosa CBS 102226]|uniref:Cytochrome P450 monooxygenase n=1 Tax=Fonsecaea multimorphosa CBS 102226 TaxID=1442371 RepID=A0A0D2H182_9EURO|nr:uncharacterized protein Z520_08720 [Fonsecaea multimorphosa CBS 102226]KIX95600.1 hypothetical protein Z520_08720 [Fonsecaea multimorphosa CBS 102226]OAL21205.1 hypothetical protein AYO22_08168 [Fonsecaea multimorphosa]
MSPLLPTLLGGASFVRFVFGISFGRKPFVFLWLTVLLQPVFLLLWVVYVAPRLSPLRRLPLASQGPWWKTFLIEPGPEDLERFMNETRNDGLIRYFGVFHGERLLITKSQGTKQMMLLQAYNYDKIPIVTKLIGQLTGLGLLVAAQDEHKRQRKSLLPAFKYKYIKNLFPRFWMHTRQLVASLEKEIDQAGQDSAAVVNVESWMMRATLDIIAATGFGVEINAIQNPESDLARLLPLSNSTSREATFYRLLAFLLPYWLYVRLPMARRCEIDQIVKALDDATLPMIQSRRKALVGQKSVDPDAQEEKSGSDPQEFADTDIISNLLQFKEPFTDKELMAQSATILAAGQDTTSVATTWALYLLAHNPQVQSTLRVEVQTRLPSPSSTDETVDAPLIESLPYLAAVCNETLRLFPPAPILRRHVVKPGTVVLDQQLPIGTVVMTSIWGTHRTKSIWGPDAKEFKPERFLQYGEDGKMHFDPHAGFQGEDATYCYLPFGAGPRSCIGERYARGEFATLLAGLVGRFEWSLVNPDKKMGEDLKVNFGIVSKPEGGLWLRARKVDGW